jgi:hypothetical protein
MRNTTFGNIFHIGFVYATIAGVGWYDWGNSGLNDHERRMNGLPANQSRKRSMLISMWCAAFRFIIHLARQL